MAPVDFCDEMHELAFTESRFRKGFPPLHDFAIFTHAELLLGRLGLFPPLGDYKK